MSGVLFDRSGASAEGVLSKNIMLGEVQAFDWASSPIGPMETWAPSICSAVRVVLSSKAAMCVLAGRDGVVIYNDAMREMFGAQYGDTLGKPVAQVVPEEAEFYR